MNGDMTPRSEVSSSFRHRAGSEEWVNQQVEEFKQGLIAQELANFGTPHEYIEYFEENCNINEIIIPDILLNPFEQR